MTPEKPSVRYELRIFFRGTSRLDEAIRKVRPRARFFLLRRLAEDGWRLKQKGIMIPVDLNDWALQPATGAPVSVRYSIDDDSPLSKHLRSFPAEGRGERSLRMETLREFAAAGLAAHSHGFEHIAISNSSMPGGSADGLAEKNPATNFDDNMSHLPFGSFSDEVTVL